MTDPIVSVIMGSDSDFDVMGGLNSDHEKHHLEGNIGAGGALIDLTTHNGGIRLRKSVVSSN